MDTVPFPGDIETIKKKSLGTTILDWNAYYKWSCKDVHSGLK